MSRILLLQIVSPMRTMCDGISKITDMCISGSIGTSFDFKNKMLTINKSYQRLNGQDVITSPKTKKSNRFIKLPDFLCDEMLPKESESENPTLDTPAPANQAGWETDLPRTESFPSPGQNVSYPPAGELAPNKNYINNNNGIKNNQGEMRKSAYGRYGNVFLSEEELRELQDTVPDYRDYIEKISEYQESSGKKYRNHAAAIHSRVRRDESKKPKYNREAYCHFKADDSL